MALKLLDALYSEETGQGTFRLLADAKTVKYVEIDEYVYNSFMMGFGPVLIPQLPPFPPGSWRKGLISKDPNTGKGFFSRFEEGDALPQVKDTWHSTYFDVLRLETQRIRHNVTRVLNLSTPSILKRDHCLEYMDSIERETAVYRWLQGTGIGTKFYGHAIEHGRVVGFVVEEIVGARHAGPEDLEVCQKALAKMHDLGIRHGDINKFNFAIKDGVAVMIDFSETTRGVAREELDKEMVRLEDELNDPGFRGGVEIID